MQQTAHRKQKLENDGGLGGGKVGKQLNKEEKQ